MLVLGKDDRAFLSIIRSLGRKNICVHVGWCDPFSPALKSKYVAEYKYIPSYSMSDSWKKSFIDLLKKEKYDLVIPSSDPTIIPLQKHKDELDKISKIYLLEDDCYKTANDKFEMQKLAVELGINVPKEIEVSKTTSLEHIFSNFSLPVVLKPQSSFAINKLDKKKFVTKAFTADELQNHLNSLEDGDLVCAQQNFVGKGVGIELLAKEGQLLYAFQHLRIHEPLHGGGSSYRKSVPLHKGLLEASEKLIKALNYTGVAMVEFKLDLSTNTWVFIEINARFWGSLPLAVASGADFPFFLYAMLVEGKTEFNSQYRRGLYSRNISKDLGWLYQNLKADRSNPYLETRPLLRVALEGFNLLFLKERYDTFTLDDPKPGFAEIDSILNKSRIVISNKLSIMGPLKNLFRNNTAILNNDINSILFVCKGNICRSPFAHHYLRTSLSSEIKILSAGYFPTDGRPSPPEAVQAGLRFGIDLSAHRSTIINPEIVEKADVIFTFDEENYRTVAKLFPSAKRKIFRVTSLDPKSPITIKDPFGKSVDYFFDTYTQIKNLIDSMLESEELH